MRSGFFKLCAVAAWVLAPTCLFAQTAKEPAWHVPQADSRFRVAINPGWLAPVEVYLADLPANDSKGLAFDATKAATPQAGDEKKPRVQGTCSFDLKPEFKWFTFRARGRVSAFADDRPLKIETLPDKLNHRAALAPGSKTLRLDVDCDFLAEAGFRSSGPKVARAVFCLPGSDPKRIVPLVFGDDGKQVGAVTLWAHPGEPTAILFDNSAGRSQYCIYPTPLTPVPSPPGREGARPEWIPEAGVIFEARYLERYDARVKSLDGFVELWKKCDHVAAKMDEADVLRGFLPAPLTPFPSPPGGEGQGVRGEASTAIKSAPRGAPLALSRYVGHVHLPADDEYRFHFKAWQGGFLVVDGQLVIELQPADALALMYGSSNVHRSAALELSAGPHRFEVYQYGQNGQFHTSLGWSSPTHKNPRIVGQAMPIIEPIAGTTLQAFEVRDPGTPVLNFSWPYRGDRPCRQCLGQWPAEDLVTWRLSALITAPGDGVECRWRFDDGSVAKGKDVDHTFCRTGMRQVKLEAVDGKTGAVLASKEAAIHVQPRWDWPESHSFHLLVEELTKRAAEFPAMPIGELLNVHAWACQFRRNDLRGPAGLALSNRLDDIMSAASGERLLALAGAFAEPEEKRYAEAEKLLREIVAKSPRGSHLRQRSSLALASLLIDVYGKPQEATLLLAKVSAEAPVVDLTSGWKVAFDTTPRALGISLDEVIGALTWDEEPKRLPIRYSSKGAEGLWLKKEFTLSAEDAAKPLELDFGRLAASSTFGPQPARGMGWVNGAALGEPWQWSGGRVTAPAKLLRTVNQLVVYLRAATAPEFYHASTAPAFEVLGPERGTDLGPHFQRRQADALAHLGKLDEAEKLLRTLSSKSWPLDEFERVRLAGDLRVIRRLGDGPGDDPVNALDQFNALLNDYPLLRLDPETMLARALAHLGLKEDQKAFLLARQLLQVKEQSELTRRQLLLCQVRSAAALADFELARMIYKQLADLSPYSPETVRARETIIRAAEKRSRQ